MRIGPLSFEQGIFLAPMEDVSERPFRRICRRLGADMVYTEFVSSEALIRNIASSHGKIRLADDEHPVGIQIYGNREEALVEAARVSEEAGPDLIDINFGCPAKKVACKGAGSGLLREPDLLVSLTRSVVKSVGLPVTVKTRLGWDHGSIIIVDLARRLEDVGVRALTLHARTRQQMFRGQADWEWIARVKRSVSIPVIGNGDIRSPSDVRRMFDATGCDAVMVGRAAIGNPWVFRRARAVLRTGVDPGPPSLAEQVEVYYAQLSEVAAEKGERRALVEMRKHLATMLRGEPGIAAVRAAAMQVTTLGAMRGILDPFLSSRPARRNWERAQTAGAFA